MNDFRNGLNSWSARNPSACILKGKTKLVLLKVIEIIDYTQSFPLKGFKLFIGDWR